MELLIWVLLGCFLGTLTGLAPGLHVNSIAVIALAFGWNDFNVAAMVCAMAIVPTFVDSLPSIFLGAPDSDNFQAVLPGHRMLLEGKGFEAVSLTVAGGLFGGMIAIALSPVFSEFALQAFGFLPAIIPFALIAIMLSMAFEEKGNKRKNAAITLLLSGIVGVIALQGSLQFNEPLLAMVSGFFGESGLLYSLKEKTVVPKQDSLEGSLAKEDVRKGSLLGIACGAMVATMPAISTAQAAFIAKKIRGKSGPKEFLVLLGCANTAAMILSFSTLFAVGKARTGAAAAVGEMVGESAGVPLRLLAASAIALGAGAILTLALAKPFLAWLAKADYKKTNALVLAFVAILVFALSGWKGLVVFAASAAVGVFAIASKTKRSAMMACLMMPTVLIYLNI